MNTQDNARPATHYSCQVSAIAPLSSTTFQIDLLVPENANLSYHPGQYLQLTLDLNNDGQPQVFSYSIANNFNPEQPRHLQIFVQNSSDLTNRILEHLTALNKSSTSTKVALPMGRAFLQTPLDVPHLLIAAGSGISKIKCIAEEIVKMHPNAEVNIYWSNKNIGDFYLLDSFQDWVDVYRKLKFTPILESGSENWLGRSGYIYQVVKEDFANLEGVKVYLCGSPQMVYGTMDKLKSRGLKEKNCYSDVFGYAPRAQKMAI